MLVMNIKRENGRWTVNDKKLKDLNNDELQFMNAFFREVKLGNDGNLCADVRAEAATAG